MMRKFKIIKLHNFGYYEADDVSVAFMDKSEKYEELSDEDYKLLKTAIDRHNGRYSTTKYLIQEEVTKEDIDDLIVDVKKYIAKIKAKEEAEKKKAEAANKLKEDKKRAAELKKYMALKDKFENQAKD